MTTHDFDTLDNSERTRKTTKADARRTMGRAASQDELADHAYKQGLREGRKAARAKKPRRRSKTTSALVRSVQAPVRTQVSSGMRTIGLCLLVVALYLFLESATAVAGVIGGLARGLQWLKDPNKSITYAK